MVADRTLTPAADAPTLSSAGPPSRGVERLRLLSRATAEVSATVDAGDTLARLVRLIVPTLGDVAAIHLLQPLIAGTAVAAPLVREVCVAPDDGRDDAIAALLSVGVDHPVAQVTRTGQTAVRDVASQAGWGRAAHTALVAPVLVGGEVAGTLTVIGAGERPPYDEADLLLVQELAARAAVVLQQAQLDARARETALALQRSLLPQRPPSLDEGAVVSRYVPGVGGAAVGGDWHDVLDLGAGRSAFVVGDVMGRGVRAAALMGQLRTAVRAYSRQHLPPAEMLRLLDGLVADLDDAQLATCVYAVHDPADSSLTFARSGHVPPLLRHASGVVDILEGDQGHPLGVGGGVFPEQRMVLPDEAVLVLGTDGLVKSGRLDVDHGLRELREALREQGDDLDELADGLLTRMGGLAGHDDDVALLVVRLPAASPDRVAALELTLGPRSVAHARQFAAMHAERLGVPAETLPTVQLLVSELATNSLLHGERPVRMRLRRTPTRLVIEMSDAGRQAPQRRRAREDEEGGRGLHLVGTMSHRWGVRPDAAGKVVWCEVLLPRL